MSGGGCTPQWVQFVTALESKGIGFEQVQYASDMREVIRAAGVTDALSTAIIETEWRKRLNNNNNNSNAVATANSDIQASRPRVERLAAVNSNKAGTSATAAAARKTPNKSKSPQQPTTTTTTATNAGSSPNAGAGRTSIARDGTEPHSPGSALDSVSHPYMQPSLHSMASAALPQLTSAAQLRGLPEEMQDAIVARDVLAAALGCSGTFMLRRIINSTSSSSVQGGGSGCGGGGFAVAAEVPLAMRQLCQTVLPVADAFVALRAVEAAEYHGRSLVAMALGEVVSEICTSYAGELTQLQHWGASRALPLLAVVSEVMRLGHHIVRLREMLPMELFLGVAPSNSREKDGGGNSGSVGDALPVHIGPRLLNHLYEQAERCAGSREDEELVALLLRRALVPYLHMLLRWMHEGVLEDPLHEFFITETAELTLGNRRGLSAAASAFQRRVVGQLFPDTVYGTEYMKSSQLNQREVNAFERRFSVNTLAVPVFLERPSRLVKMVFFAGKYCCLLRECHSSLPNFGDLAARLLTWGGADELHRGIQDSFELASATVIRLLLSSSVDLLGHLSSLKMYFLQERGNWVTDFLDSAEELLASTPEKVKVHSVRVQLQASIARCCGANDPYAALIGCSFADTTLEQYVRRRLSRLETKKNSKAGGGEGGVDENEDDAVMDVAAAAMKRETGSRSPITRTPAMATDEENNDGGATSAHRCIELLQLEADLQWPLTLVLDAGIIRRLNIIFRLLTWVKVCERSLCALWYNNEVLAGFSTAYGIKHQLIQFLRQFQFYAAHFVLEPQWGRMMQRVGQADSVFAITQAIHDFLDGVEGGLVLASVHRFRSLSAILDLTARFCEIGRHSSTATMPLIEATLSAIEETFLRALAELASPVGQDYTQLLPLLTWIDFNGYYGRNNVFHIQHGIAGPSDGGSVV